MPVGNADWYLFCLHIDSISAISYRSKLAAQPLYMTCIFSTGETSADAGFSVGTVPDAMPPSLMISK
jgi:hypothetical protein